MWTLLVWVVVIFTILVHEYGHFRLMRSNGLKVNKFSVGFGPGILKYKSESGTTFQLAPLPLGGYIKPDKNLLEITREETRETGIGVVTAGSWVNLIFAGVFTILWLLFSTNFGFGEVVANYLFWVSLVGIGLLLRFRNFFAKFIALPIGVIAGAVIIYCLITPTREMDPMFNTIWEVNNLAELMRSGALISFTVGWLNLAPFTPMDGSWTLQSLVPDKFQDLSFKMCKALTGFIVVYWALSTITGMFTFTLNSLL